jgi:hypothetical protein
MRIVVISDTHMPDKADKFPEQLIADIRSADLVIHVGDFSELSVFEKLKSISKDLKAVCGNMDSDDLKRILPQKEILKIGKFKIGIIHGNGAPGNLVESLKGIFKNDSLDMVIFGHSHAAFNEKIKDTIFFNPGSPTDKIFAQYNSYGVIEINSAIEAKLVVL